MKKPLLILLSYTLLLTARSQSWQQQVDYTIDVSLSTTEKTLDGFERLVYKNNSPDTLRFIWFHLWPNAYKNDRTAFSNQLLENGRTDFYFSNKDNRGYINRLDFKVNNITCKTEDHPQHIDIIKLVLPTPLPPGVSVNITTPFHIKLPALFSRIGYEGESYSITQWYPKPAVYDRQGWHPMPYLDQGEFYSEFGLYDVRITLPKRFVVAATGELQNMEEKEWLQRRMPESPAPTKATGTVRNRPGGKRITAPVMVPTPNESTKTLRFIQQNVHDFAWFAHPDFMVKSDTCTLPSGKVIDVFGYYLPVTKKKEPDVIQHTKEALRFYSKEVGDYPYNTASVVLMPVATGGSMEYPTIAVVRPAASSKDLDRIIAHELGHSWFYGALASNERAHPWLDEGLNTFYERKYIASKYSLNRDGLKELFQTVAFNKTDQPIATSSEAFSQMNYGLVAYQKTTEWLQMLETKLGGQAFRELMQRYYNDWKGRHPQPEDFKRSVAEALGTDSTSYLAQLDAKGSLPGTAIKSYYLVHPLNAHGLALTNNLTTKKPLLLSPAVGFNSYDGFMVGGLLTNYGVPPSKLRFLAIPLHGTKSKSFAGISKLAYAARSYGHIRKADFFLNASTFTTNDFKSDEGQTYRLRFAKLVPGFRLAFREKTSRSTGQAFIQWKTFLFRENELRIAVDSVITPVDTTIRYLYSTPSQSRYLNQLQIGYTNSRALYPFDVTLQVEQAQDFVRTALTANYFFNYAKGGGLLVRAFVGKFSYLGERTTAKRFANDRYHLNLSGPDGYEDYTYSDYFVGRNEFQGVASQQMMIRDGAFKVRTNLLANKVGKTDDWLAALNFSTTIPQSINPLSVLPINIPLRVFADVGTYAEAWNRNADLDRFLFNAGLHLPLFGEALNIYIPLLYSKVYNDYFKSTLGENRFWKKISFSLNLNPPACKALNKIVEF